VAYPWIVKTTGVINQFYFYCVETDFGPFFLKLCHSAEPGHASGYRRRVPVSTLDPAGGVHPDPNAGSPQNHVTYGATAHRNNARQGDDPDEVHPLPTGGDGTRNGDGNCSGIFHDDL
jgi:hypothetical protein